MRASLARVGVNRDFSDRHLRGNARARPRKGTQLADAACFAGPHPAGRAGEDACGDSIEDGLRGARGQFELLIERIEIFPLALCPVGPIRSGASPVAKNGSARSRLRRAISCPRDRASVAFRLSFVSVVHAGPPDRYEQAAKNNDEKADREHGWTRADMHVSCPSPSKPSNELFPQRKGSEGPKFADFQIAHDLVLQKEKEIEQGNERQSDG